jgi:EAL domain-containing protein (putative c-di-GMP-specific phosphodiesterase class I)
VHSIKIDKGFVDRVTGRLPESALARAIVQLGGTMGLATVAEGVETAEQAAVLRDLGCGYGQGYWFARPMPNAALERLVRQTAGDQEAALRPS